MKPRNRAATIALVKVLVERSPSDLKLGYLTVLTIMAERKSSTATSSHFHLPRVRSCSLSWIISKVRDETKPAADGMGNPRKSLPPPLPMAARQLNRARRKAPQIRYMEAMNHPQSA